MIDTSDKNFFNSEVSLWIVIMFMLFSKKQTWYTCTCDVCYTTVCYIECLLFFLLRWFYHAMNMLRTQSVNVNDGFF